MTASPCFSRQGVTPRASLSLSDTGGDTVQTSAALGYSLAVNFVLWLI